MSTLDPLEPIDPKYKAFKKKLVEKKLSYFRTQDRDTLLVPYFYKGQCAPWCKAFVEEFPELTLRVGFYGNMEHYWCTTPKGQIIDPTVEQFYMPAWGGAPGMYRLYDEEKDAIYLGKCMNCGTEIYGLKKLGRQDICPPEDGEEESECALAMYDYYNNLTARH